MTGQVTTQVLDTTHGCPAANLTIELWFLDPRVESQTQLKVTHTNLQGRTDEPLITQADMETGTYEILFLVGSYFRKQGSVLTVLPFLNEIPVRFAVNDITVAYHIPLLISPWAYTTYLGQEEFQP